MDDREKPTTIGHVVLLTLVALTIRVIVAFGLFGHLPQTSDALAYAHQARAMVAAGGLDGANFWPVGRAFGLIPFLVVFGTSDTVVRANTVFFDVLCVLMVSLLAHQVLLRRSAARLAGWIAAFYPPMVLLSGWSYSVNATMLFLLGFSCLAIAAWRRGEKWNWTSLNLWLASGCFLGFAVLTRPSTLSVFFMGLVGWLGVLIARRIQPNWCRSAEGTSWWMLLSGGVAWSVGVLACVVPIFLHNASYGERWSLSTNNEWNFFAGNNPYTPNYKTWHWGQHRVPESAPPEMKAYFQSFPKRLDARQKVMNEAIRYIKERPDIFILRTTNRLRTFWGFDYYVAGIVESSWPASGKLGVFSTLALEAGGYCLVMFFVIGGLFLFSKTMGTVCAWYLVAVTLAYQLPYALSFANGVNHIPVMGLLFPFAAVFLDGFRRDAPQPNSMAVLRKKWFWIAVGCFILVQVEYAYQVFLYHAR